MKQTLVRTNQATPIKINGSLTTWMGLSLAVGYWWIKPVYGQTLNDIPNRLSNRYTGGQSRNKKTFSC